MIRFSLFFILLLLSFSVVSQHRSALESSRLSVLQEIEKKEKELQLLLSKKQQLLGEIERIESGRSSTETFEADDLVDEEADDNLERLIALNNSIEEVAVPEPVEEPIEESPSEYITTDFSELLVLQENLLRDKVRADQLNEAGYKETGNLVDAMIRERHLTQLTEHINDRQAENLKRPLRPEVEPQVIPKPTERVPEETTEIIQSQALANDVPTESLDNIFTEISELTDKEGRVRLQKNVLEKELEALNQNLDAVLRQPSTFGSTSTTTPAGSSTSRFQISQILQSKGFLPWPIRDAKLIERFGPQNASGSIRNTGVKINSVNSAVASIHKGVVEKIITNSQGLKTLVVRHDDSTVSHYIGLNSVIVAENEAVNQNQQIGECTGLMEFELWQNNSAQNPLHWLQNN